MDENAKLLVGDLLRLGRELLHNKDFADALVARNALAPLVRLKLDDSVHASLERLQEVVTAYNSGEKTPEDVRGAFLDLKDTWSTASQKRSLSLTLPVAQAALSAAATVTTMLIGSQGVLVWLGVRPTSAPPAAAPAAPAAMQPTTVAEDAPLHAIQLSILVLLVLVYETVFRKDAVTEVNSLRDPRVVRTFQQFSNGWRAIYACWILLYAWFLLSGVLGWSVRTADVGADVINVVSSVAFAYTFAVLDLPSVSGPDGQSTKNFNIFMGVTAAAGVAVCAISVADRLSWPVRSSGVGPLLNGVFAGLAMSFFVGRLDSHVIQLNRGWLALLYSYALIQGFYPMLTAGGSTARKVLFVSALVLKIAFLLIVGVRLVQKGTIVKYLHERKPASEKGT